MLINHKKEQLFAKENVESIGRDMPEKLAKMEARLYDSLSKSQLSPINKLIRLYERMDKIYAYVAKFTPCKKSCDRCCYYAVTISEIEVSLIESEYGIKRSKAMLSGTSHHGSPCVFLKNHQCSIYKARPFVCRRHHTFTSSDFICSHERSMSQSYSMLRLSEVDRTYNYLRSISNSHELIDIRDAFINNN